MTIIFYSFSIARKDINTWKFNEKIALKLKLCWTVLQIDSRVSLDLLYAQWKRDVLSDPQCKYRNTDHSLSAINLLIHFVITSQKINLYENHISLSTLSFGGLFFPVWKINLHNNRISSVDIWCHLFALWYREKFGSLANIVLSVCYLAHFIDIIFMF